MWKRHPDRIIQAGGAVEPAKGDLALAQARKAVRELGLLGFHFHPIMQHFAVNDRRYYPLFEVIDELKAAVMIDVGTTGMRARLQDKIMFGSDYPSLPYARLLKEWQELDYPDAVMEKIFHQNAERVLGL